MKMFKKILIVFITITFFWNCEQDRQEVRFEQKPKNYKYLALGDSYTIGESVCIDCRFPEQLKTGLQNYFYKDSFTLQTIARTGWTTSNLIFSIDQLNPANDFDLVTLLIGVNNQYQNRPFMVYEQEFPALVNTAITKAKGRKSSVIVVSIPDYAFTPFGQGAVNISTQIANYNNFAKNYCDLNNIIFVNITDITQQGLLQNNLVAVDNLHPSAIAYAKFVQRILPKAINILNN